MINGHAYKTIRILYDKKVGVWNLALMEMSDGVSQMIGVIPHFDPTLSHPERVHTTSIIEALAGLGLDGGKWTEIWGPANGEVMIQIKPRAAHHHKYKQAATAETLPSP